MTRHERWWLSLVAGAASGLTLALVAIIPAMPAIQEALGIPTSQAGWFTTVYLVPTVVLTIPVALVVARFKATRLFAPTLILYGVTGMSQAALDSYSAILILRVVQGCCVALAMPLTITIIADTFEGGRQIRALSVRQVVLTLSGVVLPLVGTILATLTWHAPFLLQGLLIPVGVALLLDPPPTVHAATSQLALHQRLLREIGRESVAASVMLLNFLRYFFLFTIVVYVPILVVTQGGHSLTQAGLLIAILSAASALTSDRMEWLVARVRPGNLALAACVFEAIGLVSLGATADQWWVSVPAGIVFGVGDGILAVLCDTYVARLWQGAMRRGMAAIVQTFRNAGKLIGPLVVTALLLVADLHLAFAIMGALALAVALGLVPLKALDAQPTGQADAT